MAQVTSQVSKVRAASLVMAHKITIRVPQQTGRETRCARMPEETSRQAHRRSTPVHVVGVCIYEVDGLFPTSLPYPPPMERYFTCAQEGSVHSHLPTDLACKAKGGKG